MHRSISQVSTDLPDTLGLERTLIRVSSAALQLHQGTAPARVPP